MRSAILLGCIFLCFFFGCDDASPNARLNFFDIDVLRFAAEGKKGNVMVSPASIKSTLGMLLEGAEGATATEIKDALRVSPEKDDFRDELSVFLKALEMSSSKVSLRSANALFLSKKLKLKKEYEVVAHTLYGSVIGKLDFDDARSSADTINNWVREKTQGLIPTVVEEAQIQPAAQMLLTNALFFKAPWKFGFDVKSTHSDCFYNNGVCTNVAMMDLQASLNYAFVEELRAHAFEMPYKGDGYSMIVLVPQERNGCEALIRDLPYYGLPQISEKMYPTDMVLTMPKFDIDYNENMVETLKKMRINSLFSKSANLSGIFKSEDLPYINSMYHSVHMSVNEEGTVAAAATVSFVVPLINSQEQLRVDRPFLFFIRDNDLGIVLFEGKVEEPTEFVDPSKVQPQVPLKDQQPIKSSSGQSETVTSQPTVNGPQVTNGPAYTSQPIPNKESTYQTSNEKASNQSTQNKQNQNGQDQGNTKNPGQFNSNEDSHISSAEKGPNQPAGSYNPYQDQASHQGGNVPNLSGPCQPNLDQSDQKTTPQAIRPSPDAGYTYTVKEKTGGLLGFFKSIFN